MPVSRSTSTAQPALISYSALQSRSMSISEAARTSAGLPSPQGLTNTTTTANTTLSNVSSIGTTQPVSTQNRAIEATTSTTLRTESATTTATMIKSTSYTVSTAPSNMTSKPNGGSVPTTKAGILPTGTWKTATEVGLLSRSTPVESGLKTTSRVPATETVEAKSALATPEEIEKQTTFMADAISTVVFSSPESPVTVDNGSGQTSTVASTLQLTSISSSSVEATKGIEQGSKTTSVSSTTPMETVGSADTPSAARTENFTQPSAHEEWISTQSSLATHEDEGERTSKNRELLSLEHTTGQTSSSIRGNEMYEMSSTTSDNPTWQSSTITENDQEVSSSTAQTTLSSMNIVERTSSTGKDDKHDLLSTPLIVSPPEATDSTTIQSSSAIQSADSSTVTEEIVAETSPITEENRNVLTSTTVAVANTESPEQVTEQSPSTGTDNQTHPVLSATFSDTMPQTSSMTEKDRPASLSTVQNSVPLQTTEGNTPESSTTTKDSEIRAVSSTKLSFAAAIIAATQEPTIEEADNGETSIDVIGILPDLSLVDEESEDDSSSLEIIAEVDSEASPVAVSSILSSVTAGSSSSLPSVEEPAEERSTVTEDNTGASRSPTRQIVSSISIDHNIVQTSIITDTTKEESSHQELFPTEMTSILSTTIDYVAVYTSSITENDQEESTSTRPVTEPSQNTENITEQLSSTTGENEIRAVLATTVDHLTTETSVTIDENHIKLPSAAVIIPLALVSTTREADSEASSVEVSSVSSPPPSTTVESAEKPLSTNKKDEGTSPSPGIHAPSRITVVPNIIQTSMTTENAEEELLSNGQKTTSSNISGYIETPASPSIMNDPEEPSSTAQASVPSTHMGENIVRTSTDSEEGVGEFSFSAQATMSSTAIEESTKRTPSTTEDDGSNQLSTRVSVVTSNLADSDTQQPTSTTQNTDSSTSVEEIAVGTSVITYTDQNNPTLRTLILMSSKPTEQIIEQSSSTGEEYEMLSDLSTRPGYNRNPTSSIKEQDEEKTSSTVLTSVSSTTVEEIVTPISSNTRKDQEESTSRKAATESTPSSEEITKQPSSTAEGSEIRSASSTTATSATNEEDRVELTSTFRILSSTPVSVPTDAESEASSVDVSSVSPSQSATVKFAEESTSPSDIHAPSRLTVFDNIMQTSMITENIEKELLSNGQTTMSSATSDYIPKQVSTSTENDQEETWSTAQISVPLTTIGETKIPTSSNNEKGTEDTTSTRVTTASSQIAEGITNQPASTTIESEIDVLSKTTVDDLATETSVTNNGRSKEETSSLKMAVEQVTKQPSTTDKEDVQALRSTNMDRIIGETFMTAENVAEESSSGKQTTVASTSEKDFGASSSTVKPNASATTMNHINTEIAVTTRENHLGSPATGHSGVLSTATPSSLSSLLTLTEDDEVGSHSPTSQTASSTIVDHNIVKTTMTTEITGGESSTQELFLTRMASTLSTTMDHIVVHSSSMTENDRKESSSIGVLLTTVGEITLPTSTRMTAMPSQIAEGITQNPAPTTATSTTNGEDLVNLPSTSTILSSTRLSPSTIAEHNIIETSMTTNVIYEESSSKELFPTQTTSPLSTRTDHIAVSTSSTMKGDQGETTVTVQTTVSSTVRETVMEHSTSPTIIMDNFATKTLSTIEETNAMPSPTPMTTISSSGIQTSVTIEGAHSHLSSSGLTTNSAVVHQTTNKIDQGLSSAITSSKIIESSTTDASRIKFSSIFTSRENVPHSSIKALSTNTPSPAGNRNDF